MALGIPQGGASTVSPPVGRRGRGHGRGRERAPGSRVAGPILRPTSIPAEQQVMKLYSSLTLLTLHHTIAHIDDFIVHMARYISYIVYAHIEPQGLKHMRCIYAHDNK